MNKFTKEIVDDLANKLLIGLNPEENKQVLEEFDSIEASMNKINAISNLMSVEPMTHPFDLYVATLREDEAEEGEDINNILRNTDKFEGREIEVPKVVGE